jgi:hypothetical protein
MLLSGYIDSNTVIFTNQDRRFLFTRLFSDVRCVTSLQNARDLDYAGYNIDILDLSGFTERALSVCGKVSPGYIVPYSKEYILSDRTFCSDEFTSKIIDIEYSSTSYDLSLTGDYIVIHIRNTFNINKNLDIILKICEIDKDMNIVIFTNYLDDIKEILKDIAVNILYTNNLQTYASLLASYNTKYSCKAFIGEWSGASQLAGYCCNTNIHYYFGGEYIVNHDHILSLYTSPTSDIYGSWDIRNFRGARVFTYQSIDTLISTFSI